MLIEKRQEKCGSVFIGNTSDGILDFPEKYPQYRKECEWGIGSYESLEAARSAMLSGSPNTVATAAYEKARNELSIETDAFMVRNIRRKRIYRDTGDECDADRWMTGHTQPWSILRRAAKNRSITVGIAMWKSCGNGEEEFAQSVANGVAMAEILSSAGYMIRVVAVHTAHWSEGERGFIHPLVEFGHPIDEHALMAWGQPAACRHVGFSWIHHLYNGDDSRTMGCGNKTTDDWLAMAGVDIFIAKQWENNEQKQHIAKVLEKIQGAA